MIFQYLALQPRNSVSLIYGLVFAAFSHTFFLFVFFFAEMTALFYFNIFSVLLFTFLIYLVIKKNLFTLSIVLASFELILHQILAVVFLGWEYGFQYFLFIAPALVMLGEFKKVTIPLIIATISTLSLAFLYLYTRTHEPLHTIEGYEDFFSLSILVSTAILIALFSNLFVFMTKRNEDKLLLMQKNILAANQQYESIVEDLGKDFFAYRMDRDGKLVYASKNIEQIVGITNKDIIEKHFNSIVEWTGDSLEVAEKSLAEYFAGKREQDLLIMSFIDPIDGKERVIKISSHSVKDELNNIRWFDGIVEDITKDEQLKNDLKKAQIESEKANKSKSEFLANMSHEIRTPMNGILGFVEHLAQGEKDTERLKKFNVIKNSGESLLHIINDILDFSKIESGKIDIESHPFEMNKLSDNANAIFGILAKEKNIHLKYEIDKEVPKCIMTDEVRLKQVIFNLLSNAIKFTSENGNVELSIQYNSEKNRILFSVSDNGIGIAKENQDKIFDAFSQEDSTTTRRFGGTGLGLSISSKLVSMMGGELKLESEVGKGSRFYFELSIGECNEDDIKKDEDEALLSNEKIKLSGHILVVEDNKVNQILMGMILDEINITYDIANDGIEAISMYQKNKYSLILMDENMPNMNGIEATKQIRAQEKQNDLKQIPIIAVTANAMSEDKQRFLDASMDDYISKPYTRSDIKKVLEKFL